MVSCLEYFQRARSGKPTLRERRPGCHCKRTTASIRSRHWLFPSKQAACNGRTSCRDCKCSIPCDSRLFPHTKRRRIRQGQFPKQCSHRHPKRKRKMMRTRANLCKRQRCKQVQDVVNKKKSLTIERNRAKSCVSGQESVYTKQDGKC